MIGHQLGNYRIVDKIGEGGMGAVYMAEHATLGRRAAIKVLLPERAVNPDLVNRFFHEAKTTAMLQHPNLVDIYDFGTQDGHSFIVMEYLVGESLALRMHRERPLPQTMIYLLGRQIATALQAAHTRNIVHRDLKPENVFLVFDADAPFQARVKVLDFGLAKLQGDLSAHSMTRTGSLLGTPLYMSPEQCRGIKEIDWRSDIYALGCILYEMATGAPPFIREAIGDLMIAHIQEPPVPPRATAPHIHPELESLILGCLVKRPAERIQSMNEVALVLERLYQSSSNVPNRASSPVLAGYASAPTIAATPASTTLASATGQVSPSKSSSSKRALVIGATATVVVAAAIAIVTLTSSDSPATTAHASRGSGESNPDPGSAQTQVDPGGTPTPGSGASDPTNVEAGSAAAAKPDAGSGAVADTTKPDPTKPDSTKPDSTKPDPTKPDPTKPDPTKPDPTKPDPTKPDPTKPDPTKSTVASKIKLTVTSTPPGAEIRRKSDNKLLGTTPVTLELDRSDAKLQVVAKRSGFRSDPFALDVAQDGKIDLKLRPKPSDPGGVKDGAYDPFAPKKGGK